MTKRLMLLVAGVMLALPMGASAAMADHDETPRGETGHACPDASPNAGGDPACGNDGAAKDKGNQGQDKADKDKADKDESDKDKADQGQDKADKDGADKDKADQGQGKADKDDKDESDKDKADQGQGTDGQVCPPNSPDAGNEPPCGNTGTGGDGNGNGNGNGNGDNGDDGDAVTADRCTAAAGDDGIITEDTLAQFLFDNGLNALIPLVENPQADGFVSGIVYDLGDGTQIELITDEAGCLVDLLIDSDTFGLDL